MATRSVGIIFKHRYEPAKQESQKLKDWFHARGIKVHLEEMEAEGSLDEYKEKTSSIPLSVNWVVVLGGDGTMLGAARKLGRYGLPILGVNLGGLGFLTGIPLEHLYPVIEMMINDALVVEERGMLENRVIRNGKDIIRLQVLNDVVINKRALARIIDLDVMINNEFLTTFKADGLIISTPTGSTAYNLSAGGPIIYPTTKTFIITPICPFALTNRPIILPNTDEIHIRMGNRNTEKALLTFDGQIGFDFDLKDELIISSSNEKIKLLTPPGHSYFEVLRTKLMWGTATYNHHGAPITDKHE